MKKILMLLLLGQTFFACKTDRANNAPEGTNAQSTDPLAVEQDFIEYGNLRLYAVVATDEFMEQNALAADLVVLRTALQQKKFRISEHKPFGRMEDAGAVNQLTVENKLAGDVFMMSGDVVQGGKQDRTIGDDRIIAANSIKNIPVYCVERGRWAYNNEGNEDNKPNDRIAAFNGYYNVASVGLRKSIKSGNQQDIWEKVAEVTATNDGYSDSNAYAGLENSETFTAERDDYLLHLKQGFSMENVVGLVAVSGSEIIGTDVFGHAALFQKTFESLLYSYITDAISHGEIPAINDEILENYSRLINQKLMGGKSFKYKDAIIHFTDL